MIIRGRWESMRQESSTMTDRVRWMHQEQSSHDRQRISHQQRMDLGDGVCRALQASCSQLSRWQESAKIIRGRWELMEAVVIDNDRQSQMDASGATLAR